MGISTLESSYAQFRPCLFGGWVLRLSNEGRVLVRHEEYINLDELNVYALAILETLRGSGTVSNVDMRRHLLAECGMSPGMVEWNKAVSRVLQIFEINVG